MQPIELKLRPLPNDSQRHRSAAFAIILAHRGTPLLDQVASIASDSLFRSGHIFLMPRSSRDIDPCGIVWIASDANQLVTCPAGAIALRPAAPGVDLWIPWFSKLNPSIDPTVLTNRIASGSIVQVWLPSIGLVGFGDDDALQPATWLSPNVADQNQPPWTTPPDVWSPPNQLIELSVLNPPTADSFLTEMQSEIGSPDHSLFESNESGDGVENPSGVRRLRLWILDKLDAMAERSARAKQQQQPPQQQQQQQQQSKGASAGKGKGKAFATVTATMAAAVSRLMQGERERQIQKLLQMMARNPDEALKYAIPIGCDGGFRGFAIPGTALMSRLTDFSLGSLFGTAGPADFWSIDFSLQNRLQQQYREQANREIAAGRYRRAAYIFAHLLGDLRGAAKTLEEGKFYAEAAVLYRDKLNDKESAATCLARGAMHSEACELLVSMNKFEAAGEVWTDAGRLEKAREMYQRAYEVQLSKGAIVSAATILNQHLDGREQAIELLCGQWPDGNDPVRACEVGLRWLGTDGRHDDTIAMLERMSERSDLRLDASFAHLAAWTAKNYPDHRVRIAAEDHCRIAVSRSLRSAASLERNTVLSTLANLVESDTQLQRDSLGYGRRLESTRVKKPARRVQSSKVQELQLTTPCDFPKGPRYVDYCVVSQLPGFQVIAVAIEHDSIYVTAISGVDDVARACPTESTPLTESGNAFLGRITKANSISTNVELYAPICQPLAVLHQKEPNYPMLQVHVKKNEGVVVASAARSNQPWVVESNDSSIVLRCADQLTYDLTFAWVEAWQHEGEMTGTNATFQCNALAVVNDQPVVAMNRSLYTLQNGKVVNLSTTAATIRDLAAPNRLSRRRVAVAHDQGLDVVYLDSGDSVSVCRDRCYRHCIWGGNGKLLAWSDRALCCFDFRSQRVSLIAKSTVRAGAPPVRLLRFGQDQIGVAYTDGLVKRYRVPR